MDNHSVISGGRLFLRLLLILLVIISPVKVFSKTSAGADEYVVVVHGLARTSRSMYLLSKYLARNGYSVVNVRYPSTKYGVKILTEKYLEPALKKECTDPDKKINFVTHSLGGIMVRYYLENQRPKNIGRVVMLAPPNQGSEIPDRYRNNILFKWILGPTGQELGTDTGSIVHQMKKVDFELGIIAGDRSINPLTSTIIPGPDDGKVAVERTKVDGMKDFIVVHKSHTFIMNGSKVLEQIVFFLKNGVFEKS